MSDNLTRQYMDDLLRKQEAGVTSPTAITPMPEQEKSQDANPTLYDQLLRDTLLNPAPSKEPEKTSGILHGAGSALWHFIDSALVGVPGIAARKATGETPWWTYSLTEGKTEGFATAGAVVGEAAGFLVPLKWVGAGIRGAVSAVNKAGTSRLVGRAVKKAGDTAVKAEIGLNREIAERAVSTALKEPKIMRKDYLPAYEISLKEVDKVRGAIRGSVYESLKKEFPDAADDVIRNISGSSVKALESSKGVHINNLGRLLEKGFNAKLGVEEKSRITKYVARAAEMGTSFAIYNLIHDGVHSLAGEKEFEPGKDIWDAFVFSAFLPAVEMVGGGGKVHIRKALMGLRKNLSKVKGIDYTKMTEEQANGLLKVVAKDSFLKDTIIGKEAGHWAYKSLPKDEAIDALKSVIGKIDVNTIWKDFAKYAGKDFAASMGRMILGALYFNLETIKDSNLLKALPPEEILTHLLVGAWFTKLKKPLFAENYPHLHKFEERSRALKWIGLDADNIRHYARGFDSEMQLGAAYSGLLGDKRVNQIENIFNSREYMRQQELEQWGEPVGMVENIPNSLNLAKWAHNIYEFAATSRNISEPNLLERSVNIENLTLTQIKEIQKKLERIEIEEGVTLTEDNFHKFQRETVKTSLGNVGKYYIEMAVRNAEELGIYTDHELGNKIDLDIPIRMARIPDISSKMGDADYHEIMLAHKIRDSLEGIGLIQSIKETPGEQRSIVDIENTSDLKRNIERNIEATMGRIKNENFGKNYAENIDPVDNAFLLSLNNYKISRIREDMYNITEGNRGELNDAGKILYDNLYEKFGESVPRNLLRNVGHIDLKQSKTITDEKWAELTDSAIENGEKLSYLIRMWGEGKTDGDLKIMDKGGRVDYREAVDIVNSVEAAGFKLDKDATEIQRRYYYSKLLKSPEITATHITMIDNLVAWNVGEVTKVDGRPVLRLPREEDARAYLREPGRGLPEADIKDTMDKYSQLFDSLNKVKGSYIDLSKVVSLRGMENFVEGVNDAWMYTSHFDKNILMPYEKMKASADINEGFLNRMEIFIDNLYNKNEHGERTDIKPIESAEASNNLLEQITRIEKDFKDNSYISKEMKDSLETLKKKIIGSEINERAWRGIDNHARAIEKILEGEMGDMVVLSSALDEQRFNLTHYSADRILGRRRQIRLGAKLLDILKTEMNVDIADNASLNEIASKFAQNNAMKRMIDQISVATKAWRLGYVETEYFESQIAQSERLNDFSTHGINPIPSVSYNTIEQRYGKYNEAIKGKEWMNMISSLDEARASYLHEPVEKNRLALKSQRERIYDEIKTAIYAKHEIKYDTPYDRLPDAPQKELDNFHKYTAPELIASSAGRTVVPTATLGHTSKAGYVLEVHRTHMGNGLTAEFIAEGEGKNISILLLENTGVHNSKKVDINKLADIDGIISRSKPQERHSKNLNDVLRSETERKQDLTAFSDIHPFGEPVRVPVSLNTSLIVGKQNLTDGKLNRWFQEWYNAKREFLEGVSADRNRTNAERNRAEEAFHNLEKLFGEIATENAPSATDVKQMTRAMYWDRVSSDSFDKIIAAAKNSGEMNTLAAGFFKYVSLAEAGGAKLRVTEQFLREIREDVLSMDANRMQAIDNYLAEGRFNIVGLGDELKDSGANARYIVERQLKDIRKNNKDIETDEMKDKIDTLLKSIDSSSLNAQSYLGTGAAHILYLAKGRSLFDYDSPFGTAGVKPSGWFNKGGESILLKSNFVYDPNIADILDGLKIDILTTQSAAKAFNADFVPIEKTDLKSANEIIENSLISGFDPQGKPISKIGGLNMGAMQVENIFLGKIEDRHALTSVTHGTTDFLSDIGFKSFMKDFVNYENNIKQEIGKLSSIVTGKDRVATADYLLGLLRQEGALFEESSNGLMAAQLRAGGDPNSILMHDGIQRLAVNNIVKNLRQPKETAGSYSVLVPFLEGSLPVYKGGRQTVIGGKKLSYSDGDIQIKDWNKVQYIISVAGKTKDKDIQKKFEYRRGVRRDVQIGRDKNGEWVVEDPYGTFTSKGLKIYTNEIERLERKMSSQATPGSEGKFVNMRTAHQWLSAYNNSDTAKKLGTKFYLHSLSLRMPNLAGDVAVHKVEGFFHESQGNVVGINPFDLAQIHQADFDVDAVFGYHLKPGALANEIFKFAGHSLDAYVYDSAGPVINPFGTKNSELARAGSGYVGGDSMNEHIQKVLKGKDNFGRIKKLSSSLSAILRNRDIISFGENVKVIDPTNRTDLGGFLQRYKNVLQSMIDSVKKPNFVSEADPNDVIKFILFDKHIPGDTKFRENKSKYGEENYKKFFDITLPADGVMKREIYQDIIVESLNQISASQRFLTDVFDEAGRRPPDANEIAHMRGGLFRFTNNPNMEVYHSLLNRYRGPSNKEKMTELNKMFFLTKEGDGFSQWLELKKNYRKIKTGEPARNLIAITDPKRMRDSNVGNYIVNRLNLSKASLDGYSMRLSNKGKNSAELVNKVLNELDVITALTDAETHKRIVEQIESNEGIITNRRNEYILSDISKLNVVNEQSVMRYSLLMTALREQLGSVNRYINKAGKFETNSVSMAKRKASHIRGLMDYLTNREAQFMERILGVSGQSDNALTKRYKIQTLDARKSKKQVTIRNNNREGLVYVYRKFTDKNGRIKFAEAGYVKSKGTWKFDPGYEYYILRNPIKYRMQTDKESMDSYSMLEVTGRVQPEHILPGASESHINYFISATDMLKKNLGGLASDIYSMSEKNPYAQDNWLEQRQMEDAIINDFMSEWTKKSTNLYGEVEGGIGSNTRIANLVRFLMQPEPIIGTTVIATSKVKLPAYQINKRLTNAVSRWMLREMHLEEFNAIYSDYGRTYRRKNDNVMPSEMSELYRSSLYHNDNFWNREKSPLLELVFEKGWLYMPAMQHQLKSELGRYYDKSRSKMNKAGELDILMDYGTYNDFLNDAKYYRDTRNLIDKKGKGEDMECYK